MAKLFALLVAGVLLLGVATAVLGGGDVVCQTYSYPVGDDYRGPVAGPEDAYCR